MKNTAKFWKSFIEQEMTHAAANEISYMTGSSESTRYHFAVDDKEVIQGALHPKARNHPSPCFPVF